MIRNIGERRQTHELQILGDIDRRISRQCEVSAGTLGRSLIDLPHQVESVFGKRYRIASIDFTQGKISLVSPIGTVVIVRTFIRIGEIGVFEHIHIARRCLGCLIGEIRTDTERYDSVRCYIDLAVEIVTVVRVFQHNALIVTISH